MKKVLDGIFERELKRLDGISQERALNLDELKSLDILTRSLKQFQEPAKQEENPLAGLTNEQLLQLVSAPQEDVKANGRHKTKSRPSSARIDSDS